MKNGILNLILIILGLALVGCASTGANTAAGHVKAPGAQPLVLSPQMEARAKVYKKSVHAMSESDWKSDSCAHLYLKVKEKWNWEQAVQASNSCVKQKEFNRVEELG